MNKEISAEAAAILRERDPDAVFLDVREPSELAICQIEGALHIPMAEIPERAGALPQTGPLVVFCHHGMRSHSVVEFLQARGFTNAVNLVGGIHAWSLEVDPGIRRY